MKKFFSFVLLALTACVSYSQINDEQEVLFTVIDSTETNLKIYYPQFDSIKLECFNKVTPESHENAIFCCTAAFTDDWGTEPNHDRICGEHSSNGVVYNNPSLKRNTGAFVYYDRQYHFFYKPETNKEDILHKMYLASLDGGCGFTQEMIIHNYKTVKTTRPYSNFTIFRALCEYHNQLCIIDSKNAISFGDFIHILENLGVKEALYMDMGGWNYSWYRENNQSSPKYIHSGYNASITNLLVFYK